MPTGKSCLVFSLSWSLTYYSSQTASSLGPGRCKSLTHHQLVISGELSSCCFESSRFDFQCMHLCNQQGHQRWDPSIDPNCLKHPTACHPARHLPLCSAWPELTLTSSRLAIAQRIHHVNSAVVQYMSDTTSQLCNHGPLQHCTTARSLLT